MNGLLAIAASSLVIVPILLFLTFRRRARAVQARYHRRAMVLSPERQALYLALKSAVGAHYEVMANVMVGDLITPVEGTLDRAARVAFEDLAAQDFAFALCRPDDLSPVAAVTLVAGSRSAGHAPGPGAALRILCEAADLPLVTVDAAPSYEIAALRDAVLEALRRDPFAEGQASGRKEPRISSLDDLDLG